MLDSFLRVSLLQLLSEGIFVSRLERSSRERLGGGQLLRLRSRITQRLPNRGGQLADRRQQGVAIRDIDLPFRDLLSGRCINRFGRNPIPVSLGCDDAGHDDIHAFTHGDEACERLVHSLGAGAHLRRDPVCGIASVRIYKRRAFQRDRQCLLNGAFEHRIARSVVDVRDQNRYRVVGFRRDGRGSATDEVRAAD